MNIILKIQRKLVDFEIKTGIKANTVLLDNSSRVSLDSIVLKKSEIIEYYPDVFRLNFISTGNAKRLTVGVLA